MRLKEIIQMLEELCPSSFAMSWDNVGLLVGRTDQEVHTIALALDATSEVIEDAITQKADLIVTHHPLLFSGIKKVNDSDYVGKRILSLIRHDISCYAMHTNFDVLGMADAAADLLRLTEREVLEVTYEDEISVEGIGRVGVLQEPMKLSELAAKVAEVFGIEHVRYYGDSDQMLVTCAILPGSGKGEDDGIDAVEKGIAVIDAGHYGVEKIFIPYMKEYLEREVPSIRIVSCDQGMPYNET